MIDIGIIKEVRRTDRYEKWISKSSAVKVKISHFFFLILGSKKISFFG